MTDPELEIIDPLRHPEWDELLLRQPDYTFFHSAAWARVLSESYRYRPFYFTRMEREKLSVLVPLMEVKSALTGSRAVGLPFTDYCEPILPGSDGREVMNALARFGKKAGWHSIEIRPGNGFAPGPTASSSYVVHTLDLTPGPDRLFARFHNTTKRNINKSTREGVRVTLHTSADSVAAFYEMNCRTRKEHGLPPQPYSFFKKIYDHVISRNLGFVALAGYGSRDIAGAVYFYSREKVIYKYGASLRAFQHLRPNNLVMWKAIEWSARKGHTGFCFGRTEPGHAGLRQFKSGWGGEERTINYFKYDIGKGAFVKSCSWGGGISNALCRRMPILFSKLAGRILYRHVG